MAVLLSNALVEHSDEIKCHASRGQQQGDSGLALPFKGRGKWVAGGSEAYYKSDSLTKFIA